MQCEHAQEFISEYITGELDRALVVTLENHLSGCAACTEAVNGLRRLWTAMDRIPLVEPPKAFHATLMERIAEEQAKEARPTKFPTRQAAWRGLFQPKVFAYAAVALVLLVSAEIVQVQRAALGPLGLILNVVHPAPLLRMKAVNWTPNGQGGGTLAVRLQAHAQVNGAVSRLHFHIQLDDKDNALPPSMRHVSRDGEITSDQVTLVELPLSFTPSEISSVLNLTLTPFDSNGQEIQSVEIPLAPAR